MVGGKTFEPSLKSLKEFGEMACIASPGQPRVEFSLLDFYRKNLSLYGLNTVLDGVVDSAERLKRLFAEFENKIEKLACLGQTEVMPFLEAKSVLEKALAKELRKPVFRIEEQ
jgi:NADPH:quinone reductase-like Zn-dependent oxidoreductase